MNTAPNMYSTLQMLKPPFTRSIVCSPPSAPQCLHESIPAASATSATSATSPATSIPYTLPVAMRRKNTLARITEDLDIYYTTELRTARLDEIKSYLWLAGLPDCGRPLHRQKRLGREIIITEDPNEHLVWHETRIFIKPLPMFLVDVDCWTRKLCNNKQLHEAACGFLLSYAWLVRYESDLRIAHEKGLLPDFICWATWTGFIGEFLEHIDLRSLGGVSPRYQYGELRLSRLDKIYRLTHFTWGDFVRGYMATSTWSKEFFARNFAWLVGVFAVMSVALSAMQVVVAMGRGGRAFGNASYIFSIASLFLAAGAASAVLLVWAILLVYHLASAEMNKRRVMKERNGVLYSQGDPSC